MKRNQKLHPVHGYIEARQPDGRVNGNFQAIRPTRT